MQYDSFRAMNTTILLACESPTASQAFAEVREYIETCERRFTRFSSDSELARLNRSAGSWFAASPELFSLLQAALHCHLQTEGLFDPSILPDLEQAGYTRSLEKLRAQGPDPQPAAYSRPAHPPFSAIELHPITGSVRLPYGMRIDLGGIAKGWIAEQAARRLEKSSLACAVNAGGDLFLVGLPANQPHWEVALEDPRNPDLDLMTLLVEPGAIATSSIAKRTWQQGGLNRHHLIDPRNGQPAETPWVSVTVFAPHTATAEAFAKAILIGGPTAASMLIAQNPSIHYLAIDTENQVWVPEKGEIQCLPIPN